MSENRCRILAGVITFALLISFQFSMLGGPPTDVDTDYIIDLMMWSAWTIEKLILEYPEEQRVFFSPFAPAFLDILKESLASWTTVPEGTLPTDANPAPGWSKQLVDPDTGLPINASYVSGKIGKIKDVMEAIIFFCLRMYISQDFSWDPKFLCYIKAHVQSDPWTVDFPFDIETMEAINGGPFPQSNYSGDLPPVPFDWYSDPQYGCTATESRSTGTITISTAAFAALEARVQALEQASATSTPTQLPVTVSNTSDLSSALNDVIRSLNLVISDVNSLSGRVRTLENDVGDPWSLESRLQSLESQVQNWLGTGHLGDDVARLQLDMNTLQNSLSQLERELSDLRRQIGY